MGAGVGSLVVVGGEVGGFVVVGEEVDAATFAHAAETSSTKISGNVPHAAPVLSCNQKPSYDVTPNLEATSTDTNTHVLEEKN